MRASLSSESVPGPRAVERGEPAQHAQILAADEQHVDQRAGAHRGHHRHALGRRRDDGAGVRVERRDQRALGEPQQLARIHDVVLMLGETLETPGEILAPGIEALQAIGDVDGELLVVLPRGAVGLVPDLAEPAEPREPRDLAQDDHQQREQDERRAARPPPSRSNRRARSAPARNRRARAKRAG